MLGGERVVIANLQGSPGFEAPHPFFLTPAQLTLLQFWVQREDFYNNPSMLVVSGTIKSGKSRIVADIIPRLLSLHHSQSPAATRRCPVFFHHSFTLGESGAEAAGRWLRALRAFALSLGTPLTEQTQGEIAKHVLPRAARELALRVNNSGGRLWLLLDELGAPVVASQPREAKAFVQLFKDTLEATAPCARTVATGSGMVSLLQAISTAAPNSFTLWGASAHLRVGQEPRPALALAMAQRLHSAYSTSWPPGLREHITPQHLLDSLAHEAHAGLTSPRPSLLAYLASSVSPTAGGSPAEALRSALGNVLGKLRAGSQLDAAVGLERMDLQRRKDLRALAVSGVFPTDFILSSMAHVLCEDEWVAVRAAPEEAGAAVAQAAGQLPPRPALRRLLPPYGSLLRRWVRPDGRLSVSSSHWRRGGPHAARTLVTLHENWES